MMRTVEVLIVIIIIAGAFIAASAFAILPWPRQVSPINLRRLSYTTMQTLNSNYDLSTAAFNISDSEAWEGLSVALSASLPPNVLFNLTVYDVGNTGTTQLYTPLKTISNAENLGATSDAFSYTVASSSVTFNMVPEKIGEQGGGTLYILNCSDANGWWITGYTAQSLADDLYNLLSPYFMNTIIVQNTEELQDILEGNPLHGETIKNAVIVNTFGEAVPIPDYYCSTPYSDDNYARYCHFLGQQTNYYNWTWASTVGYPFFYVSNTEQFENYNAWGIYGLRSVSEAGFNSFLSGLVGNDYARDTIGWITLGGDGNPANAQVSLSQSTIEMSNYYGIYPSYNQTATRAVSSTILTLFDNLHIANYIFKPVNLNGKTWLAGAMFEHITASGEVAGKLLPIGLTRSSDIRITALSLLSFFQPRLYRSEYTAYGTSRLIVLELGLMGGI